MQLARRRHSLQLLCCALKMPLWPAGFVQGGGSVQMAYAMGAKEAKKAPKGYVTGLSGGGQQYNVYVHRCAADWTAAFPAAALKHIMHFLKLLCVLLPPVLEVLLCRTRTQLPGLWVDSGTDDKA